MKNPFIVSIILVLTAYSLAAQVTPANTATAVKTFHYELLVEAPIYECNIVGLQLDTAAQVAPKGAVFSKIDTKGSNVIIRFWLWQKDDDKMTALNYTDSTKTQRKYFLLSLDEFNAKAIPRNTEKPSFSLGATTIPFRVRTSPFDFSPALSFGTSFGVQFPLSHYQDISLNVVGGLHITHVTLDSFSTEGTVLDLGGDSEPALSPALGIVFEYKNAQVGLYIGWDYLSSEEKNNWIYQGKTWFSIGVGTSIFNSSATANLSGAATDSQ
ncbi:MAG: hypothetical protein AAFZ15_02300 [Bacteroidota bacterium]